jgi:hypothetical protein
MRTRTLVYLVTAASVVAVGGCGVVGEVSEAEADLRVISHLLTCTGRCGNFST